MYFSVLSLTSFAKTCARAHLRFFFLHDNGAGRDVRAFVKARASREARSRSGPLQKIFKRPEGGS